jgi:hypothetical protein
MTAIVCLIPIHRVDLIGSIGYLFVYLAIRNLQPIACFKTKAKLTTLVFVKSKLSCYGIPAR